MKVKLNGKDRLFIIDRILPKQGKRLEMITTQEVFNILQIKSEEYQKFGLVEPVKGKIQWDAEKILIEDEFDLKKPHTELLKAQIDEMDGKGEWDRVILDTCLKIEKMR